MNPYIQHIHIHKVRHLANLDIALCPPDSPGKKHLILTGKDGSGKTSLLKIIKKYLNGI